MLYYLARPLCTPRAGCCCAYACSTYHGTRVRAVLVTPKFLQSLNISVDRLKVTLVEVMIEEATAFNQVELRSVIISIFSELHPTCT